MTNIDILQIAMEQSAEDIGCKVDDFISDEKIAVPYMPGKNAKKYYKPTMGALFISYGNNIVAAAIKEYYKIVNEYIHDFQFYHCMETPNLHCLIERLATMEQTVCLMSEFYLPDLDRLKCLPCEYDLKILQPADFEGLYFEGWNNALCYERKHLDKLCVGAYDGDTLVGLAGCSADAEQMWQIGVDVRPGYRRKGIASAMTSRLACEILERGKVPFYCSAWSNMRSVRNAIKSGFRPTWVEMTVQPRAEVDELNY